MKEIMNSVLGKGAKLMNSASDKGTKLMNSLRRGISKKFLVSLFIIIALSSSLTAVGYVVKSVKDHNDALIAKAEVFCVGNASKLTDLELCRGMAGMLEQDPNICDREDPKELAWLRQHCLNP